MMITEIAKFNKNRNCYIEQAKQTNKQKPVSLPCPLTAQPQKQNKTKQKKKNEPFHLK